MTENVENCIWRDGDYCNCKARQKNRIGGSGRHMCAYHIRYTDLECGYAQTKTLNSFLE